MKKAIVVVAMLVGAVEMNAQEIKNNLSKQRILPLECKHTQVINLSTQDTSSYVWCGFQNIKYTSITDIGSVFITSQTELDELISALKIALKLKTENPNLVYSFTAAGNEFDTYEFNKTALYIQDGRKYTAITMDNLAKWIEYLETIKF
jgi:hypothetical protein